MDVRLILVWLFVLAGTAPALSQYTYVILNRRDPAPEMAADTLEKLMKGHLANIGRMAEDGKLLVAGPFEGGGGVFILNTRSVAEAQEWLRTDPAVRAQRWNVEILPFELKGAICRADTSANMVPYTWIRFRSTGRHSSGLLEEHRRYLLSVASPGKVISQATFPEPGEGVLVLGKDAEESIVGNDPAVKASLLTYERKKWWVAEGSFCEATGNGD